MHSRDFPHDKSSDLVQPLRKSASRQKRSVSDFVLSEPLDIVEHISLGLVSGAIYFMLGPLGLQRREEAPSPRYLSRVKKQKSNIGRPKVLLSSVLSAVRRGTISTSPIGLGIMPGPGWLLPIKPVVPRIRSGTRSRMQAVQSGAKHLRGPSRPGRLLPVRVPDRPRCSLRSNHPTS